MPHLGKWHPDRKYLSTLRGARFLRLAQRSMTRWREKYARALINETSERFTDLEKAGKLEMPHLEGYFKQSCTDCSRGIVWETGARTGSHLCHPCSCRAGSLLSLLIYWCTYLQMGCSSWSLSRALGWKEVFNQARESLTKRWQFRICRVMIFMGPVGWNPNRSEEPEYK